MEGTWQDAHAAALPGVGRQAWVMIYTCMLCLPLLIFDKSIICELSPLIMVNRCYVCMLLGVNNSIIKRISVKVDVVLYLLRVLLN